MPYAYAKNKTVSFDCFDAVKHKRTVTLISLLLCGKHSAVVYRK